MLSAVFSILTHAPWLLVLRYLKTSIFLFFFLLPFNAFSENSALVMVFYQDRKDFQTFEENTFRLFHDVFHLQPENFSSLPFDAPLKGENSIESFTEKALIPILKEEATSHKKTSHQLFFFLSSHGEEGIFTRESNASISYQDFFDVIFKSIEKKTNTLFQNLNPKEKKKKIQDFLSRFHIHFFISACFSETALPFLKEKIRATKNSHEITFQNGDGIPYRYLVNFVTDAENEVSYASIEPSDFLKKITQYPNNPPIGDLFFRNDLYQTIAYLKYMKKAFPLLTSSSPTSVAQYASDAVSRFFTTYGPLISIMGDTPTTATVFSSYLPSIKKIHSKKLFTALFKEVLKNASFYEEPLFYFFKMGKLQPDLFIENIQPILKKESPLLQKNLLLLIQKTVHGIHAEDQRWEDHPFPWSESFMKKIFFSLIENEPYLKKATYKNLWEQTVFYLFQHLKTLSLKEKKEIASHIVPILKKSTHPSAELILILKNLDTHILKEIFSPHDQENLYQKAISSLIKALKSKKKSIRISALSIIEEETKQLTQDKKILDLLFQCLTDQDHAIYSKAEKVLSLVGEKIIPKLLKMLKNKNSLIQIGALRTFGAMGKKLSKNKKVLSLLLKMTQVPHPLSVREQAVEALKNIGENILNEAVIQTFLNLLKEKHSGLMVEHILATFENIAKKTKINEAPIVLKNTLKILNNTHHSGFVRAQAVRTLETIGGKALLTEFQTKLRMERDERVKKALLEAIENSKKEQKKLKIDTPILDCSTYLNPKK